MWMSVLSVLIPAVILIAALVYVAFYAGGYSVFQKIVVVVIAFIAVMVAEALLWMGWAGRKGMMTWQRPK